MLGFLAIGFWALRLLGDFWGRILTRGGFNCSRNNGFSQLLPSFALAMIGVGLAAPAAMSQTPWVAGASYIASSFFLYHNGLGARRDHAGDRHAGDDGAGGNDLAGIHPQCQALPGGSHEKGAIDLVGRELRLNSRDRR